MDIEVPEGNKLIPESTGIKLMLDLLHRSRFQFPGMGIGFIKRMLDDAIDECKRRFVGGKALFELDQVKFQISKIQSAFTICSGMCHRSSEYSGIENNLASDIVEANSIKAYLTDLMQECAQTLTQLCGGNGYKQENIAGRGIMDSRPFQIFEGANDMLYSQIGESILKLMKRLKTPNVYEFLMSYDTTKNAVGHFKEFLSFNINESLAQRKIVDFGKIVSRVISANQVVEIGAKGFRPDLIAECLKSIKTDISNLVNNYANHSGVAPICDYNDGSNWLKFA